MSTLRLKDIVHPDWLELKDFKEHVYHVAAILQAIAKTPLSEYVWPKDIRETLKPFSLISPKNIKAVILGVEPYVSIQAFKAKQFPTGIPFTQLNGSNTEVEVINRLFQCVGVETGPTLKELYHSGIMIVNFALTGQVGMMNAHVSVWRNFTVSWLGEVSKVCPGIPVAAIGSRACKLLATSIPTDKSVAKFYLPHPKVGSARFITAATDTGLIKYLRDAFNEQ